MTNTDLVYKLLSDYGSMTMAEVCNITGLDKWNASAVLHRLNHASPRRPKRIYIVKWVYDQEGQKRYPRALYDIGDHADAPKPKRNMQAVAKRYRDAKRSRLKTNFVFNLASQVRV